MVFSPKRLYAICLTDAFLSPGLNPSTWSISASATITSLLLA